MDDEDIVRTVAGKMLEFLGYEAVLVRSGEAAVETYQAHQASGKPFAAVILDWLVVDGMDGFKTLERLRRIDPGVKGILSSGYPEQDQGAATLSAGFASVIGKPYEMKTLKETLERVVGEIRERV